MPKNSSSGIGNAPATSLAHGVSAVQYAPVILDALIAPECSTVTECKAPELPELPNYVGSHFLNNLFRIGSPDKSRPLDIVFLRHLSLAVHEYRSGRDHLGKCVAEWAHSAAAMTEYLEALSHYENAVVRAYLALLALRAGARIVRPGTPSIFTTGDGSPADRLRLICNALKHYDEDALDDKIGTRTASVWIINDGLRSNRGTHPIELKFSELSEILTALSQEAKFLSEDVYHLAM